MPTAFDNTNRDVLVLHIVSDRIVRLFDQLFACWLLTLEVPGSIPADNGICLPSQSALKAVAAIVVR